MPAQTLIADPDAMRLDAFASNNDRVILRVSAVRKQAICPLCKVSSGSLHSHYVRRVADLPWMGVAVSLELRTRKFRCRNSLCSRRVFCERLPKVVAASARRTNRLADALLVLAFALGGEAGSRTAKSLQRNVSGDTLLNAIRRSAAPAGKTTVNVLGVDDWAKKKGQTYGTILVDLERHCPVDLLPDRERNTLAEWLRQHPGIKTVSPEPFANLCRSPSRGRTLSQTRCRPLASAQELARGARKLFASPSLGARRCSPKRFDSNLQRC